MCHWQFIEGCRPTHSCSLFRVTFAVVLNKYSILFLFVFLWATHLEGMAQDSLRVVPDSVQVKEHSPLFAGIASAVIPGAGQVYNQKYWKVPIVYAGLATTAFFAWYNADVYFTVKKNLDSRVAGDSTPEPQFLILNNIFSKTTIDLNDFTYDELIAVEDDYRRYFTISLIVGGVVYALNIVDAVVDAHLFYFDVSDDLSLQFRPEMFMVSGLKAAPGLSFTLSLK